MKRETLSAATDQLAVKQRKKQKEQRNLPENTAVSSTPTTASSTTICNHVSVPSVASTSVGSGPKTPLPYSDYSLDSLPDVNLESVDTSRLDVAAPSPTSTPASTASLLTPESALSDTVLSATGTEKCKACTAKFRKCSTLRKGNIRLRRKVAELKKTIRGLQSVSSYLNFHLTLIKIDMLNILLNIVPRIIEACMYHFSQTFYSGTCSLATRGMQPCNQRNGLS